MNLWSLATQSITTHTPTAAPLLFDGTPHQLPGFLVQVREAIRLRRWQKINDIVVYGDGGDDDDNNDPVEDEDTPVGQHGRRRRLRCWVDDHANYTLDDLRYNLAVGVEYGDTRNAQRSHQMYVALFHSLHPMFLSQLQLHRDRYTVGSGAGTDTGNGPLFLKVILSVTNGDVHSLAAGVIKHGPDSIVVTGAGCGAVNGVYRSDGTTFQGSHRYVRTGLWDGANHQFNVYCCYVADHTRHWYLSIVHPGNVPGTAHDVDLYTAPVTATCRTIPPADGWVKIYGGRGVDPAPTLEYGTSRRRRR